MLNAIPIIAISTQFWAYDKLLHLNHKPTMPIDILIISQVISYFKSCEACLVSIYPEFLREA